MTSMQIPSLLMFEYLKINLLIELMNKILIVYFQKGFGIVAI